MTIVGDLMVRIGGDDSAFIGTMGRVENRLKSSGKKMMGTGRSMTTGLTLPIVGAGIAALKTAGDFEFSMNKVSAITGATGKEMEAMEDQAKELGASTQFSASEAAGAMEFLGMAGFKTNDILSAMPGTLDLAAAGNMELAETADIVSNVLTGFGEDAAESGRLADIMAKTITTSNTNMSQLGEAMKYVAPVANSAGMAIEETSAVIGQLGNAGIQGSMAGTTLRGAISRLLNPSAQARDIMSELGVTATDSSGKLLPMADIVEQLGDAGADTGQLMEIFGQRAGPGMAALIDQGANAIREQTGALSESGGTAKRIADKQMEGLRGAMLRLKAAGEAVAIAIGESGLLEQVTGLAESVGNFMAKLSETNPMLLKIGVIILGVVAAAGPLLMMIGAMVTGFGAVAGAVGVVLSPIGLVIGAVVALVAGLIWAYHNVEEFREIVQNAADFFMSKVVPKLVEFGESIMEAVGEAIDFLIAKVLPKAEEFGRFLIDSFTDLVTYVRRIWPQIQEAITHVINVIAMIIRQVVNVISAVWRAWGDDLFRIAKRIFGFIRETISNVMKLVQGIIETVLAVINGDWGKAWDGIKKVLAAVWDQIKAIVSGAFSVIKSILGGALSTLQEVWRGAWDKIKGVLAAAWGAIKRAISTAIDNVIRWHKQFPGRIVSALRGLNTLLVEKGRELISGLWNAAISKFGDMLYWLGVDLPATIRGVLFGIGSWLWSMGRDLIQGLINGVGSMVGALKNKVTDTIGGAIDAGKGILGLSSPSKVFMQFGEDTGAGFIIGMDSMRRKIAAAGEHMTNAAIIDPDGNTHRAQTLTPDVDGLNRYNRNGGHHQRNEPTEVVLRLEGNDELARLFRDVTVSGQRRGVA